MKQHLKSGFSAIEFVIGIMISAILITISLTIYNQISKSCDKIQNITSQDLPIIILQKRISDDLMGLCPLWFTKEDTKEKSLNKNTEQQSSSVKNNNYFYAQTNNEQLDCMTFISTNTLQSYPAAENHIARIIYLLKKDPNRENFFILQRKEEAQISNHFDIEKIKEGKFYTIMQNIKKCMIEYGFIEKPEDKQEQTVKKEWKMKWVQQWSEKQAQEKKDKKEETPNLPDIIKIKITTQEIADKPEQIHTFYCLVPQSKNITITSLAKKRKEKETAAQQTNMSNAGSIIDRINNAAKNSQGITHA